MRNLEQRTRRAEHETQRVGWLRLSELVDGKKRVGEGHIAKVENGREIAGPAKPAQWSGHTLAAKNRVYHANVLVKPSSSVNNGFQFSISRALAALNHW